MKITELEDLATVFKMYREENGLSQKQLADKLDLVQQNISRIEKSKINPSLEFLIKILNKMGYEIIIKKNENGGK